MSMLEVNGLMLKDTVSAGALQSAIPANLHLAALPATLTMRVELKDDGRVCAIGGGYVFTLGYAEVA